MRSFSTSRLAAGTFALLALAGGAFGQQSGDAPEIVVEQAEIMLPPGGAPMMSGYLIIRNDTAEPIAIEAVESEAFGSISVHMTSIDNGVASMRPAVMPLPVPAHSELQMRPGGMHLMISQPSVTLEAGEKVPLSVRLQDGSELSVDATLQAFGSKPSDHHHGATHE